MVHQRRYVDRRQQPHRRRPTSCPSSTRASLTRHRQPGCGRYRRKIVDRARPQPVGERGLSTPSTMRSPTTMRSATASSPSATRKSLSGTIRQMLPEHAGGTFEAVTMGDRTWPGCSTIRSRPISRTRACPTGPARSPGARRRASATLPATRSAAGAPRRARNFDTKLGKFGGSLSLSLGQGRRQGDRQQRHRQSIFARGALAVADRRFPGRGSRQLRLPRFRRQALLPLGRRRRAISSGRSRAIGTARCSPRPRSPARIYGRDSSSSVRRPAIEYYSLSRGRL